MTRQGLLLGALTLTIAMPARGAPLACKPVQGVPADFMLSAQEADQVAAGGITVRHRGVAGTQINEFFSAGYVQAPLEKVFTFYEDYRNTPKYQDSIKTITEIAVEDRYRQLEYWLELPFPIGHRHFVLDLAGDGVPGHQAAIWWSLDHGDIKTMRGSYFMRASGQDRTLVKYHIIADMNTWLPSWLVGLVQGGTIPNVVAAARKACQAGLGRPSTGSSLQPDR